MNKKNDKDARGRVINVRLTEREIRMARELRKKFNINISSLIRNTIETEYEKILQRN